MVATFHGTEFQCLCHPSKPWTLLQKDFIKGRQVIRVWFGVFFHVHRFSFPEVLIPGYFCFWQSNIIGTRELKGLHRTLVQTKNLHVAD